jgi:hypothetical protein
MNTGHEFGSASVPTFLKPFFSALAEAKVRFRAFTGEDRNEVRQAQRMGYIGGHEADMQIAQLSDPQRFEKRSKT